MKFEYIVLLLFVLFVVGFPLNSGAQDAGGAGEGDGAAPKLFYGCAIPYAEQTFLVDGGDVANFSADAIWGGDGRFVAQFSFYDDGNFAPSSIFDQDFPGYTYKHKSFGIDWTMFPGLPFNVLNPVGEFYSFDAFIYDDGHDVLYTGESFIIRTWNEAFAHGKYDFKFKGELPYINIWTGTYLAKPTSPKKFHFWPRFDLNCISDCNPAVEPDAAFERRWVVLDVKNFTEEDGNGNPKWEQVEILTSVDRRKVLSNYYPVELDLFKHVSRTPIKKVHFRLRVEEGTGETAKNSVGDPLVVEFEIPYIHR
jgi:hypothetical protein